MNRNYMTFADIEISNRLEKIDHVLFKIEKLVDWEAINKLLEQTDYRNSSYYGRDCYDPTKMFRVMIAQRYYNLSDREMEIQLLANFIVLKFCKFSMQDQIPDYTTICRWRKHFMEFEVFQEAFDEIINQLANLGIGIKNSIIIDATITESYSRPKKIETIDIEPTGDEPLQEQPQVTLTIEESKDPDARWIKKGKKCVYGYKAHTSTNKDGLINGMVTTPANVYDGNMLQTIVDKVSPKHKIGLYADKGYDSKSNRDFLNSKNIEDYIMRKKNLKQFAEEERVSRNKNISSERYVVERTFGSLKSTLGFGKSKYVGLRKTHNYNILGAMLFNLIRTISIL